MFVVEVAWVGTVEKVVDVGEVSSYIQQIIHILCYQDTLYQMLAFVVQIVDHVACFDSIAINF